MAYLPIEDEDENQTEQQGAERVLSNSSGQIDAGSGQGGGSVSGGASPRPTQGSKGWTNLQNYVAANEGTGQRMAGDVSSKVTQRASDASQAGQSYATTASERVRQGTANVDNDILKAVREAPTTIAGDEGKKQAFNQQLNATYAGPQAYSDIEGFQDAGKKYKGVAQNADQARTFEGRSTLLDDVYGRPSYTRGEKNLDSFLIGGGDGRDQMEAVAKNYGTGSQFENSWDELLSKVSGQIDQGRATTDATRNAARETLDSEISTVDSRFADYKSKADQTNATNTSAYSDLAARLGSTSPKKRAKAFESIGLDAGTGEWLASMGYTLPQLVAAGKGMMAGDYASEDDVSRYSALSDLAGRAVDPTLFEKGGGDGTPYSVNRKAIETGTNAKKIHDDLQKRLADAQAKRDYDLGLANAAIAGTLQGNFDGHNPTQHSQTGMDLGIDLSYLSQARELGIDPSKYLKAGSKLNVGDVATDAERKGWTKLMRALGLNSARDQFRDVQDEGKAASFDKDALVREIMSRLPARFENE